MNSKAAGVVTLAMVKLPTSTSSANKLPAESMLRISANVTGDFGNVTDFESVLCCAGKIVGMVSV